MNEGVVILGGGGGGGSLLLFSFPGSKAVSTIASRLALLKLRSGAC